MMTVANEKVVTDIQSRRDRLGTDQVPPVPIGHIRPMSCSHYAEQNAVTAKEQRRANIKASLRKMLQSSSRLVESQRRLLMCESNAAAAEAHDEPTREAFECVTIANKHVECDAAVLDAALEEVTDLILGEVAR